MREYIVGTGFRLSENKHTYFVFIYVRIQSTDNLIMPCVPHQRG
jgi:hypothetical protein